MKRTDFYRSFRAMAAVTALVLLFSCSVTKNLPENESILRSNNIIVTNSKSYNTLELFQYLKQKPNSGYILGWNPSVNLYYRKNGNGGGWDRFIDKYASAPVLYDAELVEQSVTNLKEHLKYEGLFDSKVDTDVVTKNRKTSVTYNVTLGKQYVIDSVEYFVPDGMIKDDFYSLGLDTYIPKGSYLSESSLESISENLAQALRDNGYFSVTKNHFSFIADTLSYDGHSTLEVYLKNHSRKEKEENSIIHNKYKFGRIDVIINKNNTNTGLVVSDTTEMDSENYRGLHLYFKSPILIRRSVIDRYILMNEGDVYSDADVASSYKSFTDLGVFSSVNVTLNNRDSSVVDTKFELNSSPLQGYKLNLQASVNSNGLLGISPNISYYHKNIFKGGEKLTVSVMGDFQFHLHNNIHSNEFADAINLSFPDFVLLPKSWNMRVIQPRSEIAFSHDFQYRPEYTRMLLSLSYGYTWMSKSRKFQFAFNPLSARITKIYNISDEFLKKLMDPFLRDSYMDHFDFGMTSSILYNSNPSDNQKRSYHYVRILNDLSGNILSVFNGLMKTDDEGKRLLLGAPYAQYFKTEISYVRTLRFGHNDNQQFAVRALVGVGTGYGNSSTLPFEKRFWAGGAYSLRGWSARSVGPGAAQLDTTFSIPSQTGDARLELNAEYRFPIAWVLEGALFADAGNVWNWDKNSEDTEEAQKGVFRFDTFYKQIACDWGLGIRLNLKFAILRLDWGLKIYEPGKDRWMGFSDWFTRGQNALQFGIGYPF